MRGDHSHHTLRLGVVQTIETLNQFKETDGVFRRLDGRKCGGRLKIIFEIGGALIVDVNVGLGHAVLVGFEPVRLFSIGFLPFIFLPGGQGDRDQCRGVDALGGGSL